jgi:hypothetical protein
MPRQIFCRTATYLLPFDLSRQVDNILLSGIIAPFCFRPCSLDYAVWKYLMNRSLYSCHMIPFPYRAISIHRCMLRRSPGSSRHFSFSLIALYRKKKFIGHHIAMIQFARHCDQKIYIFPTQYSRRPAVRNLSLEDIFGQQTLINLPINTGKSCVSRCKILRKTRIIRENDSVWYHVLIIFNTGDWSVLAGCVERKIPPYDFHQPFHRFVM